MEKNILILNVMRYKKEGKEGGTRISFALADKEDLQDTNNFKGLTIVDCFYKYGIFETIPTSVIGKCVKAHFKSIQSYKNPLDTKTVVESIEVNGNVIGLLQHT